MDAALALGWLVILVAGGAACALLFRWGMPRTYVRDILHVGAGVWIFGWLSWRSVWVPSLLPLGALLLLLVLPHLSGVRAFRKFSEAIADQDERWSGILLYTFSFAVLTPVGLSGWAFPAGAALLALALGDGIGGLVGRRLGRIRFRLPFAKPKSLEGTLAVFVAAWIGIMLAAAWFGVSASWLPCVLAAASAAIAEAVAPRATDNVLVPAAVFAPLAVWPS